MRGGETHRRGLSGEQVCAPCAIDRNGGSIAKASNLGRVSIKRLNNYLAWSGFANYAKEMDGEKRNRLLLVILAVPMRSVCRENSSRSALPAQLPDGKAHGATCFS